mgnify:CR=1 FL=1
MSLLICCSCQYDFRTFNIYIDAIIDLPQAERDRVMTALIELMLLELFELRMVQTDPNFANYQYRASSGQIVLLDFGATRRFKASFVNNYRKLIAAPAVRPPTKPPPG